MKNIIFTNNFYNKKIEINNYRIKIIEFLKN